nr:stress response protein NST1-like [Aedes albopictus]
MPRSTRSAPGGKSDCTACNRPDTLRMVSCCQCGTWWHFECVNVNDSIAETDRTFFCPKCQKPSPTIPSQLKPTSEASRRKAVSLYGVSSTSSIRARRARLQLEKLEAEKALMERRLEQARREQLIRHEQEKRMQEAEIEQARLKMEQAIIEENFRVREEELMEEESDGRSVSSEQSSISKVQQWQKEQPYSARTSTMTEAAPTTGGLVHTQVALTIGSEGNIVDEELEASSLQIKLTEGGEQS